MLVYDHGASLQIMDINVHPVAEKWEKNNTLHELVNWIMMMQNEE